MQLLINTLESILDNDEKVLIFTQYVKMGKIIKRVLEDKFDEDVLFLHGSLSRYKRDKLVRKFQSDDDSKIFILSLKAGGTGLNLTAACNVIHYDLWWNPAVENQATDRAYRIGQDVNVMVYRFITTGTFEERINDMLADKQELADITIGSGGKFITEMDDDTLRQLLRLRNRID
jgi:SNF2 family DNA or RNA helicase